LRNPKYQRPLLSSTGLYKIPCFCGKLYIGKMVNIRMKEHLRDVKLRHITLVNFLAQSILLCYYVFTNVFLCAAYYIIFLLPF